MVAGVSTQLQRGAFLREVSIIGINSAKNVSKAYGAAADGALVFRRKLTRVHLLRFMAAQPPSVVAMGACASSHHWG